jgi:ketosteroid isomerase-like protein
VHSAAEVEAAMGHYDSLIKKTDADSIAWMFTADGWLGEIAHGRDSIRSFLRTFKNVRVLEVGSATKNITLTGDTARQAGSYTQTALVNGKDTAHVRGKFEAEWVWSEKEGWKIRRMATRPE